MSNIVKFLTDINVPANTGISASPLYTHVDGHQYINIYVTFDQMTANEPPLNLGVIFALDASGAMGARRYVNLEANVPHLQGTNFIEISGREAWSGNPHNVSHYMARLPVMGPFVRILAYNNAAVDRKVSVWGYLTP